MTVFKPADGESQEVAMHQFEAEDPDIVRAVNYFAARCDIVLP